MWMSLPNEIEECYDNVRNAHAQRSKLCEYFVSPAGELDWQYNFIRRGLYEDG